jgi:hypothetical protein
MLLPSKRVSQFVVGGVFSLLGCGVLFGFYSVANHTWTATPRDSYRTVCVGDLIKFQCCKKPEKTPCSADSSWGCATSPVVCTAGTSTDDTCGNASCSSVEDESSKCNTSALAATSITVTECKATGSSVACSTSTAKCAFSTSDHLTNETFVACATGSTACSSQPTNVCQ